MLTYWSQLRGCGNENHAKSNDSGMLGLEYSSFKGFGWVTRLNQASLYTTEMMRLRLQWVEEVKPDRVCVVLILLQPFVS